MASTPVVIVGGGLIGLSSALALHERGAEVTVVDAAALGSGAARGNAGFLCPTLLAPLPGPGMLRNAARALVDRDGSLRIRPGAVPSMARWGSQVRPGVHDAAVRGRAGRPRGARPWSA